MGPGLPLPSPRPSPDGWMSCSAFCGNLSFKRCALKHQRVAAMMGALCWQPRWVWGQLPWLRVSQASLDAGMRGRWAVSKAEVVCGCGERPGWGLSWLRSKSSSRPFARLLPLPHSSLLPLCWSSWGLLRASPQHCLWLVALHSRDREMWRLTNSCVGMESPGSASQEVRAGKGLHCQHWVLL